MAETLNNWKILKPDAKKPKGEYPNWLFSVLANRGIKTAAEIAAFLAPKYEDLLPAAAFLNMAAAAERIGEALDKKEKVVVYGDYDVDGITATAMVAESLNKIGVQNFETYIPHREEEGYGLNPEALRELQKNGAKLVVAVDCGITAGAIIDAPEFADLDFIVCDHHEIDKADLPQKSVNLHPSFTKKGIPAQDLSACGLSFFLLKALQEKYPAKIPAGQEKWFLDLAALATICDVVPLTGQNRLLAKYGLMVLAKSKRPGIEELAKTASLKPAEINSYAVGFLLGPRLNAAGRLEHAREALNLLLTQNTKEAQTLALHLSALNNDRQKMCERILAEAKAEIENGGKKDHEIYLLANKNWPRGVVGIIAGRLAETYARPVIVFEHDGENYHGSARSVEGFDITEALGEVSEHIIKFGGHAKAAGLTVEAGKFVVFQEKLLEITRGKIKKESLAREVIIDAEIEADEINDAMLDLIAGLEPFGYGNHTPTFIIAEVEVAGLKKVGSKQEHLKFNVKAKMTNDKPANSNLQPPTLNAIWFNYGMDVKEKQPYDLAFTLRYNVWNERKTIELRIIDMRIAND